MQTPEEGEFALRHQAESESTSGTGADSLRAVMLAEGQAQAAELQTLLSELSDQ